MLLQAAFNYHERGMKTLCFLPEVAATFHPKIESRIGISRAPIALPLSMNVKTYVLQQQNAHNIACILVDEAQFLTRDHVHQLASLVDEQRIPVLTYGLRTDFQGHLFEGSQYLLAWADHLIEIKTICFCGSKAIMTARLNPQGLASLEGNQIECGGNDRYVSLCRKHYQAFQAGKIPETEMHYKPLCPQ